MTSPSLIVRPATLGDAAEISSVDRASHLAAYAPLFGDDLEFFPQEENVDRWRRILSGQAGPRAARWVLVASIEEHIVGYAGIMPSRDSGAREHVGEVGALYVHPDWWRRGVGSTLLGAALDFLASQGFTEAILWVLEGNHPARAFYAAEGWTDDGGRQAPDNAEPRLVEARYRKLIGKEP